MTRPGGDDDVRAPFGGTTEPLERKARPRTVPGFRLTVTAGPDAGRSIDTQACGVGTHASNQLVLTDPAVSRFHCEIEMGERGARIRDLDSSNGTTVDGLLLLDGYLRDGSTIQLGRSSLRFGLAAERYPVAGSERDRFGDLIGSSPPMRQAFALLEHAAATSATVLIEGETGTGKEVAAEALHRASARAAGPLVVVDCGAIPHDLLESELFGHERGAFTGAVTRRTGAIEEADGGTLFLDEIGELPLELQTRLLRVLDKGEVRPIGQNAYRAVDVRFVAATNRDLRSEVNAGRFRADLYFRLAVIKIVLPPLRQRQGDLPALIMHLLDRLDAGAEARAALLTPEFMAAAAHGAWPGNVRELRNYLERCLVFKQPIPVVERAAEDEGALLYEAARERAVADFERRYAEALLARHGGKVAQAAAAAKMNRTYLYRLVRRYGLKG